ncbi:MAG: DNA gyrase subunit B [Gemmataceae bacterium]|nr:DNA gyrase subunit B [Gemmataceae bacterium]MCI0737959.1 DNA gyrase subunit B [Gemmataceae bacterium]
MNDEITSETAATAQASEEYGSDNVDILRDAAHIRARPGMYIGDSGPKGLHHLVYELVYNSVDEALAGYCKNIHVEIEVDGSISVSDDGRGIPVDIHPKVKRPTLEVVMTTFGAGAKFDRRTYKTSAGLHGIGAKAVTALSEWTEAQVRRGGKVYTQEYERGSAITEVKEFGVCPPNSTGTKISFHPDPEIFHDAKFDYDLLENRLRELAFLNKGLAIKLTDMINQREETFVYKGGVAEFVEYINRTEEAVHKVLYVDRTVDDVRVEIGFQYTSGEDERVRCYANNAHNPGGGTHLSGFRTALTRVLNTYGAKENKFKNDLTPIGEDFREGITAVVSIQLPDPQFESQTKIKLNNPEVDGIVTSVLHDYLSKFLEENPKEADKIMKKVVLAAEAREAAARAKRALKDRKSLLSSSGPTKLMDCLTKNRNESELFLVEGQSAGGSADNGRNRQIQAILPLRGKVINVEKARVEKVLENGEIISLISAIGIDIGNTEDLTSLRYGKVILLTDADVDGQHIRTLLLTFFYRQMRQLLEKGHIWVARPPLFKVEQKKSIRYVQTLEEMSKELLERGRDGTRLVVTDAANPKDPAKANTFEGDRLKTLMQALEELENALVILERRGHSIPIFLGKKKDGKLPTFRVLFGNQEHWFFSAQEVDRFREEKIKEGRMLMVAGEQTLSPLAPGSKVPEGEAQTGDGNGQAQGEVFSAQELHEVRTINRGLDKLRGFGLAPSDLVPAVRIAGRDPEPRFFLEHDGKKSVLPHVRVLVAEVRMLGERGIKITRFKGLGEMDGEELWETTLDPARRTMLRVQSEDALAADEMFRILMGEKVEPRREFIQKHALEVKEIDYHGA